LITRYLKCDFIVLKLINDEREEEIIKTKIVTYVTHYFKKCY
jgi:hypothetical protein